MGGHGQLRSGGNDYGGMRTVFVSFVRCALVCQPATPVPHHTYASSFDSLASITYFSALPPAMRRRPVLGFNQMSPGGDYSLRANGKLEKS